MAQTKQIKVDVTKLRKELKSDVIAQRVLWHKIAWALRYVRDHSLFKDWNYSCMGNYYKEELGLTTSEYERYIKSIDAWDKLNVAESDLQYVNREIVVKMASFDKEEIPDIMQCVRESGSMSTRMALVKSAQSQKAETGAVKITEELVKTIDESVRHRFEFTSRAQCDYVVMVLEQVKQAKGIKTDGAALETLARAYATAIDRPSAVMKDTHRKSATA